MFMRATHVHHRIEIPHAVLTNTDVSQQAESENPCPVIKMAAPTRCALRLAAESDRKRLGLSASLRKRRRAACPQDCARRRDKPTSIGGQGYWLSQPNVLSRCRCCSCPWRRPMSVMAPSRPWRSGWLTPGPSSPSCPAAYPRRGGREQTSGLEALNTGARRDNHLQTQKCPLKK